MFFFNSERRSRKLLVEVFFIISIIYFFSSIFFGLDFTDSFYHLNSAIHPADGIYLYPFFLSSVIIKGLIELAGKEVIYLRLVNSFILFFSILMPFFLIKVKKPRVEVLLYIALVLLLFTPFNVNILGYDTLSILILSLIFSLSVKYFQKPGYNLLILLSITCALSVLIRLPNLLVIPIVLLWIINIDQREKGMIPMRTAVLFFLFTLFFTFLGYSLYYSTLEEFFKASAISSSHDLTFLFYNYLLHGLKLLVFMSFILTNYFIYIKIKDRISSDLYTAATGILFIVLIIIFVIHTKYSQNYSLFLTSLTLCLVIILIFKNRRKFSNITPLILFLLFLFINPFGSNTGLLKAVFLFLLVPFILSYHNWEPDSFWKIVLIILIPFSIIENTSSIYEDSNFLKMNSKLQTGLLKPIKTTETRANFLEDIESKVSELRKKKFRVYFYGDKSHVFHYLYPETSMDISSFFQPVEDLIYYPLISEKIEDQERVALFIVDSYPENRTGHQHELDKKLTEDGFRKQESGSIMYYLKTNN